MQLRRLFPTRGVLERPPVRPVDLLVGGAILALLYAIVRVGQGMGVPFLPETAAAQVSTDPANLPYYSCGTSPASRPGPC